MKTLILFLLLCPVMLRASSVTISSASLPGGVVGTAYSGSVNAINGQTPYTWSISSGALPPGLSGAASSTTKSYLVTGTPTAQGTYSFSVKVRGHGGATSTKSYTVTIAAGQQTVAVNISPSSMSMGVTQTAQFTATVTGTTNTAVTWTASCGTIDGNGLYTAPSAGGSCMVTATSQADSTKSASAPVTVQGVHSVLLTWNASTTPDVTGYNVYRNNVKIASVTSLTYTDENVSDGTNYSYDVTAVDPSGESQASNVVMVTIPQQ